MKGHSWLFHKGIGRQMCSGCGLVWLRNPVSNLAAKRKCSWE